MKKVLLFILCWISISFSFGQQIELGGNWNFKLDPEDVGLKRNWQTGNFEESLILPGSLASNNKGYRVDASTKWTGLIVDSTWFKSDRYSKYRSKDNFKTIFWLQPDRSFVGAAWYSREFTISEPMSNGELLLSLERAHWETTVWIDGKKLGMRNSLAAPHDYLSEKLTVGSHRITIRVDNRIKDIDVGINAHSISDHTQTNWNGIVGKIVLKKIPQISLSNIKVYPDIDNKCVRVVMETQNNTGKTKKVNFLLNASSKFSPQLHKVQLLEKEHEVPVGKDKYEVIYPIGDGFYKWDEFNPYLYDLTINCIHGKEKSTYNTTFGMRKLGIRGTQFEINNRLIFLRGTLDCAVFPKTGFPPTDLNEWKRIFHVIKSHGLNHIRFHSWCPPEAAFAAADELGVYVQAEGGGWTVVGDGNGFDKWIYKESRQILDTYGNHPSFITYTYGNEPEGKNQGEFLGNLIDYLKKYDGRHFYTSASGWPDIPSNDFYDAMYPRMYVWGDGLKSQNNANSPSTDFDWKNIIRKYKVPYISHEVGQWCAYPNFKEISKYDGVLKARNFEVFQEMLMENKLGYLAEKFLMASGRHQALTYKADIEAALRTPGFAGYQLLGLSDFPGQGTALVGVLDAFWEEKGYISPEEFKSFSGTTVPLVRLSKMVYTNSEILNADVEIAHFGEHDIKDIVPTWELTLEDGNIVTSGRLNKQTIHIGNAISLGKIEYNLSEIMRPEAIMLNVNVGKYHNRWKIWVYPSEDEDYTGDVILTDTMDEKTYMALEKGKNVLFSPRKGSVNSDKGGDITMGYSPIFWNTAWTKKQPPHVMGILVDPKHPALSLFPTDYHSDAQWWGLVTDANAMVLDSLGDNIRPIVRVIDDWFSNRSLGLIVEGKLGNGKIIVSTADLFHNTEKRLEVDQMKKSLLKYMNSNAFDPNNTFEKVKFKAMFH
ncbi:sugar-binding domain-containing protein [Sphingobacterium sp.]|uniref:sugar-binding domain-containing protein n=1 Tax=Sphingobacterium sp. TaxID=341027 RepID=UPI0031D6A435